jgi:hypothetical protein
MNHVGVQQFTLKVEQGDVGGRRQVVMLKWCFTQ